MSLYRPTRPYRNGVIVLSPGKVVDLDGETAEQIERDSAGTLRPLTGPEVDALREALEQASAAAGVEIRPDWRPDSAAPVVSADDPDTVMSSATMWGGR